DRQCWVLVRVSYETSAVSVENIFNIMRLAILVQYRRLRIVTHARSADLVNDDAAIRDSVGMVFVKFAAWDVCATSRLYDGRHCFLHIFRHLDFVVAPLPMET